MIATITTAATQATTMPAIIPASFPPSSLEEFGEIGSEGVEEAGPTVDDELEEEESKDLLENEDPTAEKNEESTGIDDKEDEDSIEDDESAASQFAVNVLFVALPGLPVVMTTLISGVVMSVPVHPIN